MLPQAACPNSWPFPQTRAVSSSNMLPTPDQPWFLFAPCPSSSRSQPSARCTTRCTSRLTTSPFRSPASSPAPHVWRITSSHYRSTIRETTARARTSRAPRATTPRRTRIRTHTGTHLLARSGTPCGSGSSASTSATAGRRRKGGSWTDALSSSAHFIATSRGTRTSRPSWAHRAGFLISTLPTSSPSRSRPLFPPRSSSQNSPCSSARSPRPPLHWSRTARYAASRRASRTVGSRRSARSYRSSRPRCASRRGASVPWTSRTPRTPRSSRWRCCRTSRTSRPSVQSCATLARSSCRLAVSR